MKPQPLIVWISPERKHALKIDCVKKGITMKEAIEAFIDELTGKKSK